MLRKYDNRLHFSDLKHIEVSPLNYKDKLESPSGDTRSYLIGRAAHRLWLLEEEPVIWVGRRDLRNEEYSAAVAQHGEKLLNKEEAALVYGMVKGLLHNPQSIRIKEQCNEFEKQVLFERNGIPCSMRLDMRGPRILAELKTSQAKDMHPKRFQWLAKKIYHYTEQLAWYAMGDNMAETSAVTVSEIPYAPRSWPESWIIAVESTRPHDVVCHRVSPLQLDQANDNVERWLETLASCMSVNTWPGRAWEPVEFDAEIEIEQTED